jgi:hypothetical protein
MNDQQAPRINRRSAGFAFGGALLSNLASAQPAQMETRPPPPAVTGPATFLPTGSVGFNLEHGRAAIGIVGGPLFSTFTRIADDIARFLALNAPQVPRVIPMIGTGGPQVAHDVLSIEGMDGFVASAVVMDSVRRFGWVPEVTRRLTYVAELYTEETHIVTTRHIGSLQQLNGRVVNVGVVGGGTDVIARRLFELLNITPIYDNGSTIDAFRSLPTGNPAATVFVAGRPVQAFQDIEFVGHLQLLPIPPDPSIRLQIAPLFRPTMLEHADYPRWIHRGQTLATVASSVFLMTEVHPANSERQRWVSRVVTELLQSFVQLRAGAASGEFHPKWRDINVLTRLPGYARSPEVNEWFNATGVAESADVPGR